MTIEFHQHTAVWKLEHGRPKAAARGTERDDMDRMREETRKRFGTVEVAVDLIRDARDR